MSNSYNVCQTAIISVSNSYNVCQTAIKFVCQNFVFGIFELVCVWEKKNHSLRSVCCGSTNSLHLICTFCNSDKDFLYSGKNTFVICTKTLCNLEKYRWICVCLRHGHKTQKHKNSLAKIVDKILDKLQNSLAKIVDNDQWPMTSCITLSLVSSSIPPSDFAIL